MSKILIAGANGYVGRAVKQLFPEADEYDIEFTRNDLCNRQFKDPPENHYDFAMICVPTPSNPDGGCNISAVEDVVTKINADVFIIRSTIPPGTTERFQDQPWDVPMGFVFQPEYCSSKSPYPSPLGDLRAHPFLILGGRPDAVKKVRRLYETVYQPIVKIYECSSLEAELIKLFENTAIANKVTLCQEFYEICNVFNVDYDKIRQGVFDADPRFNTWFTNVYPSNRGFSSSHCLSKDLANLIYSCKQKGYDPEFIEAIIVNNRRWKNGGQ